VDKGAERRPHSGRSAPASASASAPRGHDCHMSHDGDASVTRDVEPSTGGCCHGKAPSPPLSLRIDAHVVGNARGARIARRVTNVRAAPIATQLGTRRPEIDPLPICALKLGLKVDASLVNNRARSIVVEHRPGVRLIVKSSLFREAGVRTCQCGAKDLTIVARASTALIAANPARSIRAGDSVVAAARGVCRLFLSPTAGERSQEKANRSRSRACRPRHARDCAKQAT
jgi:hypothetical protein